MHNIPHHYKRLTVWISLAAMLLYFAQIFTPIAFYSLGNIFFGTVPTFYNVNVAQFFYTYAAYPVVGNPAPYAHHQLSRTYFIEGDLQTALTEADKELAQYPENRHTYYIKGLTLGYMHREHEAIKAFGQFIAYKPESWAARNDKAWLHFRVGEMDEAMATILPAVQSTKNNPWLLNTFGVLLMNEGALVEARNAFAHGLAAANSMTAKEWGIAYPGNAPQVYETGLTAMKKTFQNNLNEVEDLIEKDAVDAVSQSDGA